MHTGRFVSALAAIAALGLAAPAGAAPFVTTIGVTATDFGAPTTFSFSFNIPIALSGPVDVILGIAGALGDGARDGASLAPTSGGTIGSVRLNGNLATAAGAGTSFAGAGGTAGLVYVNPVLVTDFDVPSTFGFTAQQPIAPTSQRTTSQAAVAGALLDGGFDGGSLTGNFPGGGIARFSAVSGGNPVPGAYELGGPSVPVGTTFTAAGSGVMECSGADICDFVRTETDFQMSGGDDIAALVLRHEFGGDEIAGTVVDAFGVETANALFDCDAVGGCSLLNLVLGFEMSGGGDAAALAVRIEINALNDVTEPASLALFGAALAAAGLARRRRRRFLRVQRWFAGTSFICLGAAAALATRK